MAIADALLGFATGAAGVVNEDAAKSRDFMRKQKAKIAESRLVRQEKKHDASKAQFSQVQKYGTGETGQYMHAFSIFKDHNQAVKAVKEGMFAKTLSDIKDPGEFIPYAVGVSDEEFRSIYGDTSMASKLMSKFGKVKGRRQTFRDDERAGTDADSAALFARAQGIQTQIAPGEVPPESSPEAVEATLAGQPTQGVPGIEVPVQGTTDGLSDEFLSIEKERTLGAPKLQSVEGFDTPIMVSFDSKNNEYVFGDQVFSVSQVNKAPEQEEVIFDELFALRNKKEKTAEDLAREQYIMAAKAPWKFNTIRNPDGSETTEMFRLDPITGIREDIGQEGKAPGAIISGLAEGERQKAGDFMATQVQPSVFSDNVIEGIANMSGNVKEGFKAILASRANEHKAAGVRSENKAMRLALIELTPAFLREPATTVGGFELFKGDVVFDLAASNRITDIPVVLEGVTDTGLMQPPVKDTTSTAFTAQDKRAQIEALRREQQRRAQQQ